MIRSTLLTLAVLTMAPFAHAQTSPITGEWTGKYFCSQGVTALHLTIQKGEGQKIAATFSFGPLPENPDVSQGSYQMRGTYDPASRRIKLDGAKWIKEPLGYVMVGLDGQMASSGQKISGHVPDLFSCTDFEVWRPAELIG